MFFTKPVPQSFYFTSIGGHIVFHNEEGSNFNIASSTETASLDFTDSLLERKFGALPHWRISTMPYSFDLDLWKEILNLWPEEVKACSSNKFPSTNDISQKSLFNFYLMQRSEFHFDSRRAFNYFDRNGNNVIEECELFALRDYLSSIYYYEHLEPIPWTQFSVDLNLLTMLKEQFSELENQRTEWEVERSNELYFQFDKNTNPNEVLNAIKLTQRPVVCIHDQTQELSKEIDTQKKFEQVYSNLFPNPSSFEWNVKGKSKT